MIPQRILGQSGFKVSLLGLGTVKFGRNTGVKYPQSFELPDKRTVQELLDYAYRQGINFLDTAPAYGNSEELLGELLKPEDDWIICTKAGEEWLHERSHYDFSPGSIRKSAERSLRRLRREVLDVLLIHSNGEDEHIIRELGALETLQTLKQEGLIRAGGISVKTIAGGLLAARMTDVVMVEYSPADRSLQEVLECCHRNNAGTMIKKVFNSGLELQTSDAAATALNFVAGQQGVSSIITGTINLGHLQANIAALQV